MADNQYVIKVVVTDNGGVKLAEKNIGGLGAAVDRVGASHKKANKSAGEHFNTLDKGIIGTANSTKSFSKLAESISNGGSSGLVGAYATLAANIFAVTAAFNGLRGASQVEQIFRGLEASGNRVGRTLSVAAQGLKDVTANAISTEQALRSTAQIASAGFGTNTIKALGQAARDTSFALGRNMTDSLDRLTRGVVKLEPELLDELGIMTKLNESNTIYAAKLGKSESQLSNFEKRQGFLNAVLAEATVKFGGLSEAAGDSTNYDKLSAKLADLGITIAGVLNTVFKPLAGALSGSMLLIAGIGTLFAATLKNQLAPQLLNAAASAAKSAKALHEDAQAKQENLVKTKALERALSDQQIAAKSSSDFLVGKAPKAYDKVSESIKNGTASAKEYQTAINSLNRQITSNQAMIAKNPTKYGVGTNKGEAKLSQIEGAQQQIQVLETIKTERAKLTQYSLETIAQVRAAEHDAAAASQLALTQETSATALASASKFKLKDTIKGISDATKQYAAGIQITNDDLAENGKQTAVIGPLARGVFGSIKTGAFAASLSVKALGVAFLNAIPIIGQLLFAAGLISEVLSALKSDYTKELERKFDDLSTIVASVSDKVAAMNRALESTAPIAVKSGQAVTIQSNAIAELVDSFNEVMNVQEKYVANSKDDTDKVASFWTVFFKNNSNATASWQLGLKQNSEALAIFGNSIGHLFGDDKRFVAAAATLGKLIELAPSATAAAIEAQGGAAKLEQLRVDNPERFLAIIKGINNEIGDKFRGSAQLVQNLTESFKTLDLTLGQFFLSAAQTTQYDQAVKGFHSVTDAVKAMQIATANGAAEGLSNVLRGLGANLGKFLDPATKALVDQQEKAAAIVAELEKQEKAYHNLSAAQQGSLEYNRGLLLNEQSVNDKIIERISIAEKLFENAQAQERSYKTQSMLLQAHITATQQLYSASGRGIAAQIDAENKVKDLQAAQLSAQKAVLEITLLQAKVDLERLQALDDQNNAIKALNESMLIQLLRSKQITLDATKAPIIGTYHINPDSMLAENDARKVGGTALKQVQAYKTLKTEIAGVQEQLGRKQQENGIARSIQDIQNSVTSLNAEISAILESKITEQEKLARIQAKDVEIQSARLQVLNEQVSKLQSIQTIYNTIDAVVNDTTDSLKYQLDIIKTSSEIEKRGIRDSYSSNLAKLKSDLALAKAGASRANNSQERAAGAENVRYAQQALDIATQGLNIDLQRVDAQTLLATLQKVEFGADKEGLQWQQESFGYLQKKLDAQRSLSDSLQTQYELQTKLSYAKAGLKIGPDGETALQIRAAQEAYKLALAEVGIKKSLIDLEYALLDAQKNLLAEQLRDRRDALSAVPGQENRIAQLDQTIQNLSNIDTGAIAETLKKQLDVSINNARLTLQSAIQVGTPGNDLISAIRGIREKYQAVIEAQNTLRNGRVANAPNIVRPEESPAVKVTAGLTAKNEELIQTLNRLIASIQTSIQAPISAGTPVSRMSIQDAAAQARAQGFHTWQLKGDGGPMGTHAKNSAHYDGRAFDMYAAPGNQEWTNPKLKAQFDAMADKFRSEGFKVLWGVAGHFDHMHVEIGKLAETTFAQIPTIVGQAAADASQSAAQQTVTTANDNKPTNLRAPVNTPGTAGSVVDQVSNSSSIIDAPTQLTGIQKTSEALDALKVLSASTIENLKQLGPEGEAFAEIISGINTFSTSVVNAMQMLNTSTGDAAKDFANKFSAIADVASSALGTIQSVIASSAKAKEDGIDREIAAEQRRDGKSVQSHLKIQALEKQKDAVAKKAFDTNKKLQIAQAVIATASGIAQALTLGPILGPIMAAVIGAMGLAQIAVISGTSYQSTSSIPPVNPNPSFSIGQRGSAVDLAKGPSANAGGEIGYLRGSSGVGSNASNYGIIGSAYGGDLPRGYGNTAYVVGEKGPETIYPNTPMTVRPANDNPQGSTSATIHINAIDAAGVEDVLHKQKGNIISMIREAANANGTKFLEDVNVNVYSRPNTANRL
jgi:hypothetical protein